MLTIKWPAVALLALAPGIMSLAVGDEEKEEREEKSQSKIESAEIPDAVKAALKRLAGKSKIERIVVEGDEVKVFEGLWKKEGETHEATVSAQGILLETEEEVEGDEVWDWPFVMSWPMRWEAGSGLRRPTIRTLQWNSRFPPPQAIRFHPTVSRERYGAFWRGPWTPWEDMTRGVDRRSSTDMTKDLARLFQCLVERTRSNGVR